MAEGGRRLRLHALFLSEASGLRGIVDEFDGRLSRILDTVRRAPEMAISDPWTHWRVVFCEQAGFPATIWYTFDAREVVAMSIHEYKAGKRRF